MLFFFCRLIDAFVEADRNGFNIRVPGVTEYVNILKLHMSSVSCVYV
jgi:hypothetical protein